MITYIKKKLSLLYLVLYRTAFHISQTKIKTNFRLPVAEPVGALSTHLHLNTWTKIIHHLYYCLSLMKYFLPSWNTTCQILPSHKAPCSQTSFSKPLELSLKHVKHFPAVPLNRHMMESKKLPEWDCVGVVWSDLISRRLATRKTGPHALPEPDS